MDMKEDNVCHVSFKKRYENVEGILVFTRQSSSLKVILFDLGRTIIYEKALWVFNVTAYQDLISRFLER